MEPGTKIDLFDPDVGDVINDDDNPADVFDTTKPPEMTKDGISEFT